MLGPFNAASLAGTIVQFVIFSAELISTVRDIHLNGSTIDNRELVTTTRDLKQLSEDIKDEKTPTSPTTPLNNDEQVCLHIFNIAVKSLTNRKDGQTLDELGTGCEAVANELLTALADLASDGSKSRWKIVSKAVKDIWSKEKLDRLSQRLQKFQDELALRVLVSLRENSAFQAAVTDTRFATLERGNQEIMKTFFNQGKGISDALERQTKAFHSRMDRTDGLNKLNLENVLAAV